MLACLKREKAPFTNVVKLWRAPVRSLVGKHISLCPSTKSVKNWNFSPTLSLPSLSYGLLARSTICHSFLAVKMATDSLRVSEGKQIAVVRQSEGLSKPSTSIQSDCKIRNCIERFFWFLIWVYISIYFNFRHSGLTFTQSDIMRHMSPLLFHYIHTTGLLARCQICCSYLIVLAAVHMYSRM